MILYMVELRCYYGRHGAHKSPRNRHAKLRPDMASTGPGRTHVQLAIAEPFGSQTAVGTAILIQERGW